MLLKKFLTLLINVFLRIFNIFKLCIHLTPLTLQSHHKTNTSILMNDNHINYIEFTANDLEAVKAFYIKAFGWTFTDYGPNYTAFSESGLEGGFEQSTTDVVNGALVVLYHRDLETVKQNIINAGGKISKAIFAFPGGRRFHFTDPAGNELAVWSDQ